MRKPNYPKKCPRCNSLRINVYGFKFKCKRCGFINLAEFHLKENGQRT